MIYIGIDPGKDGAVCFLCPETGRATFIDIGGSVQDVFWQLQKLDPMDCRVVIERAQAFPGQGRSSAFNYGATWGALRAVCLTLGIPIIAEPTPVQWKDRVFPGKRPKDRAAQKTMARDLMRKLYPSTADELTRKKDADRAEAGLLAHYGLLMERG